MKWTSSLKGRRNERNANGEADSRNVSSLPLIENVQYFSIQIGWRIELALSSFVLRHGRTPAKAQHTKIIKMYKVTSILFKWKIISNYDDCARCTFFSSGLCVVLVVVFFVCVVQWMPPLQPPKTQKNWKEINTQLFIIIIPISHTFLFAVGFFACLFLFALCFVSFFAMTMNNSWMLYSACGVDDCNLTNKINKLEK